MDDPRPGSVGATDHDRLRFPPPLPDARALLKAFLRTVPLSLALRETHRLLTLSAILRDRPVTETILDVGVGDGEWWRCMMPAGGEHVYGIDISPDELAIARQRLPNTALLDISGNDVDARIADLGWPEQFGGIIGNCSLEHVKHVDDALAHLYRLLAPGGWFVLFVPTPDWAMQSPTQRLLMKRSPRLAMTVSGALNGFFQHWHLMDRPLWTRLLSSYGFVVEDVLEIGGRRSEQLFRLGLPPSFGAFLSKKLTGRYLNRLMPQGPVDKLADVVVDWLGDELVPAPPGVRPDAFEFAIRCRAL